MKLGISIAAFREKDIVPIIEQYQGVADRIVVSVSNKPWYGEYKADDTAQKALTTGAVVISREWEHEHEQRNDCMELLRDMDYVIVSHCDTWFTKADLRKLKEMDLTQRHYSCNTFTYWKDYDTVIYPYLSLPTILVRSDATFKHILNIENEEANPPVLDITCHHVAWVKTDDEVKSKLASYSHAEEIQDGWYDKVWKGWKPGMVDFGPTNPHDFQSTVKHTLPNEIRRRIV